MCTTALALKHICTHAHTHTHSHTHTQHPPIHTQTHTHARTHAHKHARTNTHARARAHTQTQWSKQLYIDSKRIPPASSLWTMFTSTNDQGHCQRQQHVVPGYLYLHPYTCVHSLAVPSSDVMAGWLLSLFTGPRPGFHTTYRNNKETRFSHNI